MASAAHGWSLTMDTLLDELEPFDPNDKTAFVTVPFKCLKCGLRVKPSPTSQHVHKERPYLPTNPKQDDTKNILILSK